MTTVLIAHGSPDSRHEEAIADLAKRTMTVTHESTSYAFLEHNEPSVETALKLAAQQPSGPIQTVGLFLGAGHHALVDVPDQIVGSDVEGVTHCGHLGVGPWLIPALEEQLSLIGHSKADGVALVAAGSAKPLARDEVLRLAATWQRDRVTPVRPAFASGEGPSPEEALGMLRDAQCSDPVVALLMLAPGVMADRVSKAGRDREVPVTPPLIEGAAVVERIAELTSPH